MTTTASRRWPTRSSGRRSTRASRSRRPRHRGRPPRPRPQKGGLVRRPLPARPALRCLPACHSIRSSRPTTSAARCRTSSMPAIARAFGVAFARFAGAPTVLVGRDMRPRGSSSSPPSPEGVMSQGVDVIDVGLVSTDLVYFAAGRFDAPGAMFTASHNPAQYNGVKLCLSGARPVGADTGLADIKAIADGRARRRRARSGRRPPDRSPHATSWTSSPITSCRSSIPPRWRRCASSPTPPTGWAASWCRRSSSACPRSSSR